MWGYQIVLWVTKIVYLELYQVRFIINNINHVYLSI